MAASEEANIRGAKFTMSDLARRLNVSKTSIYAHFASKQEIVHELVVVLTNDVYRQEQELLTADLPYLIKIKELMSLEPHRYQPMTNFRIYEDLKQYYPDEFRLLEEYRNGQVDRLVKLVAEGIAKKEIRSVDLQVFRQLVKSAMNDLFSYRFLYESDMTYHKALVAMADIIGSGLIPEQG